MNEQTYTIHIEPKKRKRVKAMRPPAKRKWHKPFQNEVQNIISSGEMTQEQMVRQLHTVHNKINFIARYSGQNKSALASMILASIMQDDAVIDAPKAIQYLKETFCIVCEKLCPDLQAKLDDQFDLTCKFIISIALCFKSTNPNENVFQCLLNAILNYTAIEVSSKGKEAVKTSVMSVAKEIADKISSITPSAMEIELANTPKKRGRPHKIELKNEQIKSLLKPPL